MAYPASTKNRKVWTSRPETRRDSAQPRSNDLIRLAIKYRGAPRDEKRFTSINRLTRGSGHNWLRAHRCSVASACQCRTVQGRNEGHRRRSGTKAASVAWRPDLPKRIQSDWWSRTSLSPDVCD